MMTSLCVRFTGLMRRWTFLMTVSTRSGADGFHDALRGAAVNGHRFKRFFLVDIRRRVQIRLAKIAAALAEVFAVALPQSWEAYALPAAARRLDVLGAFDFVRVPCAVIEYLFVRGRFVAHQSLRRGLR